MEGEHDDLILESGEIMGIEVLKVSGAKAAGVKAVFESVGVVFGFYGQGSSF